MALVPILLEIVYACFARLLVVAGEPVLQETDNLQPSPIATVLLDALSDQTNGSSVQVPFGSDVAVLRQTKESVKLVIWKGRLER